MTIDPQYPPTALTLTAVPSSEPEALLSYVLGIDQPSSAVRLDRVHVEPSEIPTEIARGREE